MGDDETFKKEGDDVKEEVATSEGDILRAMEGEEEGRTAMLDFDDDDDDDDVDEGEGIKETADSQAKVNIVSC